MPLSTVSASLSLALTAAMALFGATPAEAKPNPCSPIVDAPKSDASVSDRFRIKVRPDLKQNCKVDEVRVEITEIVPGGRNRQAYYSASECCDFLSNQHHIIDRRVPEGTLKPDTRYSLKVQFIDRTSGFFGGMDKIRAEYGPLAVIPVRTKASDGSATGLDPMVFALDMNGRFGHGRGETIAKAGNAALEFCEAQGCRLVSEPVRARCHALAHRTQGGYWWGVGAGPTATAAQSRAQDFCTDAAPGACETAYTYCQ